MDTKDFDGLTQLVIQIGKKQDTMAKELTVVKCRVAVHDIKLKAMPLRHAPRPSSISVHVESVISMSPRDQIREFQAGLNKLMHEYGVVSLEGKYDRV